MLMLTTRRLDSSPQIRVIGPWPYGLLQQLYYCVETSAKFASGAPAAALAGGGGGTGAGAPSVCRSVAVKVVCPRCCGTHQALTKVRNKALMGPLGNTTLCGQWCIGEDDDMGDEDEDDDEQEVVGSRLDMGIKDFATWVVCLTGDARRNKRQRVVDHTITLANAATPNTARCRAQKRHVCRILER